MAFKYLLYPYLSTYTQLDGGIRVPVTFKHCEEEGGREALWLVWALDSQ